MIKYIIIAILLALLELIYFKIAGRFNIIDKPNERSSHSKIVFRGGGIIFLAGIWLWSIFFGFDCPWFLLSVTLAAGVSFVDDIYPLPDRVRLLVQFVAMGILLCQLVPLHYESWWVIVVSLIVCVGASNIYNFMDGINGITAGYSLAVLIPILLLDKGGIYVDESLVIVTIIATVIFSFFNFRPKNKAVCFAGDVGSVSMAFILLFMLGCIIFATGDLTWLVLMAVYGVDGCLTICHRILLHENLGQAHRKHMYQIMSNELGIGHITVSIIYLSVQFVISAAMVFLIPDNLTAHWIFFASVIFLLSVVYVLFMKKYYHLHKKYLSSLGK